jgi:hypothetical protein
MDKDRRGFGIPLFAKKFEIDREFYVMYPAREPFTKILDPPKDLVYGTTNHVAN